VNAQGAISSLLTGFVLGAARFVLELLDRAQKSAGGAGFDGSVIRWLIDINFLHYSILMFVICCLVLVGVSLTTPATERKKLAGLTFATVADKMDVILLSNVRQKPAAETVAERRINIAFSMALILTVIGLWVHFR
jgi:SSS family solute:Na+ symporter